MADIKWIKIVTDIFDNRKIRQIETMPDGDTILVVWFKLICLAGTINDAGMVYLTKDIPYTDEMLARQFNRPIQTVRLALSIFEQFGMIEVVDNFLMLSSWEKYQNVESMDKIREQTRKRVAEHRERSKQLPSNASCNVTVTHSNATDKIRVDKNREDNSDRDTNVSNAPKNKRFVKPCLEDVVAYCKERGNDVDTQRFMDYYESNGWKVGKNPMKDWKAAVRTWEKSSYQNPTPTKTTYAYSYDGEEESL